MLPFFYGYYQDGDYQLAALVVVACAMADVIDGKVAKLLGCTSAFGEMFDAIADAVCYGFFLLVLLMTGAVPWAAVVIILGVGVVNTAMRAVYARRAKRATNYRSFAMERMVAYAAYLCGFGVVGYEVDFFYWGCAVLMLVVLAHDSKRMLLDPIPPAAA